MGQCGLISVLAFEFAFNWVATMKNFWGYVFSLGVLLAPNGLESQTIAYSGCWALTVGNWQNGPPYQHLPKIIRLDTTPAAVAGDRNGDIWYRLAPTPSAFQARPQFSRWTVRADSAIQIGWSTGFEGVGATLRAVNADSMIGTASSFTDVVSARQPTAPVSARRVTCPAELVSMPDSAELTRAAPARLLSNNTLLEELERRYARPENTALIQALGCWELQVGKWQYGRPFHTLPDTVHLDTTLKLQQYRAGGATWYKLSPTPATFRGNPGMTRWGLTATGEIRLIWSTGFAGISATLRQMSPDSLAGTAKSGRDVGVRTNPEAPVSARRITCASSA